MLLSVLEAEISNLASALAVTLSSALLTRFAAGSLICITASLATVGIPLTVMVAVVSFAFTAVLTSALRPFGRLVNQLVTSVSVAIALNLSLVKVMFTSVAAMAVPVVPLMVTLLTAADGAGVLVTAPMLMVIDLLMPPLSVTLTVAVVASHREDRV